MPARTPEASGAPPRSSSAPRGSARRRGRGRLSSIDLLPPEAESAVIWAMGELRERKRLQIDIHKEFNSRLADLGLQPVSLSAFNRYAIRLAATARRLEETRAIAAAVTERLGPGEADELTVMVAEAIKTLVFELLETGGEAGIGPKGAMEMAQALHHAVRAQSVSSKRRREVEEEFALKAKKAVDQVAKQKGLSAETVEAIKAKILGIER